MRYGIEVSGQIGVHYIGVAFAKQLMDSLDRVLRASFRSITIGIRIEVRFKDRLQNQLDGGLNHPVPYGRNPERPLPASGLRDHHPSHRLWSVCLLS